MPPPRARRRDEAELEPPRHRRDEIDHPVVGDDDATRPRRQTAEGEPRTGDRRGENDELPM